MATAKTVKIAVMILLLAVVCIQGFFLWNRNNAAPTTEQAGGMPQQLPNIILISLDALRGDRLSCQGYRRQTTPFLDELAKEGVRFPHAFANTLGTPPSHATMLTGLYQENHRVDYDVVGDKGIDHFVPSDLVTLPEILKAFGYNTIGVTGGGYLNRKYGFDRGFIRYSDAGSGVADELKTLLRLTRKYKSNGKPLFLFFHTYEIHSPYFPPDEYKKIFGDFQSEFVPSSENLKKFVGAASKLKKEDIEFIQAMYDAGVRYTDDQLRMAFDSLKEMGILDNCLLVITSDHGEEFGEHGGLMHRGLLYRELIQVPLIVAGNGVKKGLVDQRLVSVADIAPTILSYLGLQVNMAFSGNDILRPDPSDNGAEALVVSQFGNLYYSVRTDQWKYILNTKTGKEQLFEVKKDPDELKNVAVINPQTCQLLNRKLSSWKKQQAPMTLGAKPRVKEDEGHIKKLRSLGYVQ